RAVVRYNVITNGNLSGHGKDTSNVGARHIEVYGNVFKCVAPGGNLHTWLGMRGGTWVVHNNTLPLNSRLCEDQGRDGTVSSATPGVWKLAQGPRCYQGTYPSIHQFGWGWSGGRTHAQNQDAESGRGGQDPEPTYWWNNVHCNAPDNESSNCTAGTSANNDVY